MSFEASLLLGALIAITLVFMWAWFTDPYR